MLRTIAIYFCLLLAFASKSNSLTSTTDEHTISYGLSLGLNFNFHNPSFNYQNPPDVTIGSPFTKNKNSMSVDFAGIFNYPLNKTIVLSGLLDYNMITGDLEPETSTNILRSDMSTTMNYLGITPRLLFYNILPFRDMYLHAGFNLGFAISSNYKYREVVNVQPATIVDQDIPDKNARLALTFGLGYNIAVSDKVDLVPEVSFHFPFGDVSSNNYFKSWDVPQIRLSLGFLYKTGERKEIEQEPSTLEVGFNDIRYYDKEGKYFPLKKITIEEVQYKELFPFIPHIFCEENSEFPASDEQSLSAISEAGEFTMLSLESDALKINRLTLDIIGTRMNQYPEANITITGTNNGIKESSNQVLAQQRADFAKNYLVVNYGISQDRIRTEAAGLPGKPSAINEADGMAENRRIEIRSADKRILSPIIIEKDKQALANPDLVEFHPYAISKDSISLWNLELLQADREIRTFTGSNKPDSIRWAIAPDELTSSEIPIEYIFTATNSKGIEKSAKGTIPVEFVSLSRKKVEDKPDRTISKFSLVVFDFDKADVSEQDKEIIENNVIPEIKYNSTIQIYGYTDRIGKEDYNKNLSERRAQAVKTILMSKAPTAKYEVFGVGENNILFDNDSPVGRQLSRTVQIYIITPKE